MNAVTETIRDIYARLIGNHPEINAGELRELLTGAGLTLGKNEPHSTLHQLVKNGRVTSELLPGSKVRTYRINPDWTPTTALKTAPDASDAKPPAKPAHRPGLTALTPVTEDPRELLRRAIAQHVAEHPAVWFTCNGLAEMLDEDAADVAKALRVLVEVPGPPAATSLTVGSDAEVQSAVEAPAAQQPLHGSANAGVATGSRNDPASESVTRGSQPPTSQRRVIEPIAFDSLKKRLDDLEADRDRAVLIDVLEGLQDKARSAGTLVNAVAWLQRDAEDLAGRAVDECAPPDTIKALITASGAAARAALAIANFRPAGAGPTQEPV